MLRLIRMTGVALDIVDVDVEVCVDCAAIPFFSSSTDSGSAVQPTNNTPTAAHSSGRLKNDRTVDIFLPYNDIKDD